MSLQCLLLSRDAELPKILRPALEKLSIGLEVCSGVHSGQEILASEKYDGVIIDCDDLHGGMEVLGKLRQGTSNRNSVAFAVLHGTSTQQAFDKGANFVLQKPIQPLNAIRCFSAAFGQMTREQRRYFRVPVDMAAVLIFSQGEELRCVATNISEGGMAIHFRGNLPKQSSLRVRFTLPGTHNTIEPKADVAWADGSGHAGLRFVEVPQNSREHLERWLSSQIHPVEATEKH
jgi:CheY-like chemotaxis protein